MKTKDDRTSIERIKEMSPCTTVWTNHGEPQALDDKHFGVALQTEVETLNTETRETFRTEHVRAMEKQVIKLTAQRDELLAALKRTVRWVGKGIADGSFQNCVLPHAAEVDLAFAEKTINNASKIAR